MAKTFTINIPITVEAELTPLGLVKIVSAIWPKLPNLAAIEQEFLKLPQEKQLHVRRKLRGE